MLNQVQISLKTPLLVLVAAFIIALSSCGKDDVDTAECNGSAPTYTSDIKAILDASCAKSGCHDPITKQNGYDFSTYATAKPISQMEVFLGAVQHKDGYTPMPDDGPKLSNDKIMLLTCWVQNGSPE